ncbi:MAG: DUF2202 domain-containing protein [Gammaproteobacteria bacterium]|jgi:hypothetical protein|nr:DUF2202 domain-containing protein [Gammaproteobacteria bacterium]
MKIHHPAPWRALTLGILLGGLGMQPALSASSDGATALPELDATEAQGLTYMREEEKLARDVYRYFYPMWEAGLFENISESEQSHFEAIGELLATYRLDDPAAQDLPGVFVNPDLQALYDLLIATGSGSELAALQVGALIEETDMVDIVEALAATDQPDITVVYENLLRGSRNHLRAFVAAIEALGVPYTAQVLPQEEVDAIVDSPMERGGSKVGGRP